MKKHKQFIDNVLATIEDQVYEMKNEEINIIEDLNKLCNAVGKLNFKLPPEKELLSHIITSWKNNLYEFYYHLALPYNKSSSLIIRILYENYIILKFLLKSGKEIMNNWFYFTCYLVPEVVRSNKKDKIKIFYEWEESFKQSVNDNEVFKKLTKNIYGWAYPAVKNNLNLRTIAKMVDAEEQYLSFKHHSNIVHSNNGLQNLLSSRFDNNTFHFCTDIALVSLDYVELLSEYCCDDENLTFLYELIENIFKKHEKYKDKLLKALKKYNI